MTKTNQELSGILETNRDKYILSSEGLGDENLVWMAERKYAHAHGISMNKAIYDMPYYHWNKYSYNDMYGTHYPDGFFDVVYNLNPEIERIWDFVREAKRILSNNGILILHKSNRENGLLEGFKEEGNGKEISILKIKKEETKPPSRINIVIKPFKKFEGTYIQVEVMKKRLEEQGINVDLYPTFEDAPKQYPTVIQWEAGLSQPIPIERDNIIEAHTFISNYSNIETILRKLRPAYLLSLMRPSTLWYYFKYYMIGGQQVGSHKPMDWTSFNKEMQRHFLLSRTYEMAKNNNIENYILAPHFNTKTTEQIAKEVLPLNTKAELHIGTCGHSAASKHFEDIAELAIKLNIKATIMGSVNELHKGSIKETSSYAERIRKKYDGANGGRISIKIGQWSYDELTRELRKCTHLISAQDQARSVSNSMRFMISIGRPLISVENYQAREVQAIRVNSLREIDHSFLEDTRERLTNLDDGLRYYIKMLEMWARNHKGEKDAE